MQEQPLVHKGHKATSYNSTESGDEDDCNDDSLRYNWKMYYPDDGSYWKFLRWLCVGGSRFAKETDQEFDSNLEGLAHCIQLLREYLECHGMPDTGGPADQERVMREIARDLYAGGAPMWALESILQRAAEGLTGDQHVNWSLLPRKASYYSPSTKTTCVFTYARGFDMGKLTAMEKVAVRLASYASNTDGVGNIPTRFPNPDDFHRIVRVASTRNLMGPSEIKMAKKILKTASTLQGLFFFVNSPGYEEHVSRSDSFWKISPEESELFSRLACTQALYMIDKSNARPKDVYHPLWTAAFRVCASAGACLFWFNGSWIDAVIAGMLAVFIAGIAESSILSKQEKIIYEIVASFSVGFISGLIALQWPDSTCWGAMAIAGVLDILQGFRVVYAVIETMSKHTVSGGADLLEGILFTGLIAYFLSFGKISAEGLLGGKSDDIGFGECTQGVSPYWYFIVVPLAAVSWSGLFTPLYKDLFPMAFHGCLAYSVNFALASLNATANANNFVSATTISLSAGIFSRFTGRHAVGNTVAGLYVLLPGAYLVTSMFGSAPVDSSGFFFSIIEKAVVIGIGSWTGSIMCSPTLLGSTSGLFTQQGQDAQRGSENHMHPPATMLAF